MRQIPELNEKNICPYYVNLKKCRLYNCVETGPISCNANPYDFTECARWELAQEVLLENQINRLGRKRRN